MTYTQEEKNTDSENNSEFDLTNIDFKTSIINMFKEYFKANKNYADSDSI